mmetsp:Transcript_29113/g.45027  ORF Transcript_29113/g.45027 Transcript_29113/m.45027 type:complete len:277 (-) Transcript_29113:54-884(-)|eukprot:CAMPEP_0201522252 /NCGR_PEP_ID=MMETSP0161_2-20130828/16597_1 /ASSEMBLY_ACC=CAM_ASM_000251 /TAXON_ID=180227 /ORGANISM="Neoparamoeba aestuarina, Strain SoJaBio B1-5/56/2" /LENGTH=276 /DNA_ID=CAMNT_0047921035 /DNA_START=85 /DNA_END=915 /DNA_ORIENTATION=+
MQQLTQRFSSLAMLIGGGGLALTTFGSSCFYAVQPGERAVLFDRIAGVKQTVYGEGLHFMVPLLQWPVIYETRITAFRHQTETASKDLQTVKLTVRLLHQPEIDKLPWIFSNIGLKYAESVLPSIGNEVLKAVVAEFDADELVTQRETVSNDIRQRLIKRANHYNIILRDVSITSLEFSPEYTAAIERKQVEQQIAERQKFVVEKAKQEKEASVIRIEGETEAGRLISESMQASPEFLELRKIETAKKIAALLAGNPGVVYLPSKGGNLLLNLPQR